MIAVSAIFLIIIVIVFGAGSIAYFEGKKDFGSAFVVFLLMCGALFFLAQITYPQDNLRERVTIENVELIKLSDSLYCKPVTVETKTVSIIKE
jgi:hypothetical protein